MNESLLYPYRVDFDGRKYILLWLPLRGGDRFVTEDDGTVFLARSRREIERTLARVAKRVQWSQDACFSAEEFKRKLRGLREGRASSVKTCHVLIDGWNLTDDLLRTLSRVELLERSRSRVLKKVYGKLFYGMNLAAVTPAGRSYSPMLSKKEIACIREYMRESWGVLAGVFSRQG